MHYSGGQVSPLRGGERENCGEVRLGSGEFITTIEGVVVDCEVMGKLTFMTNKGAVID